MPALLASKKIDARMVIDHSGARSTLAQVGRFLGKTVPLPSGGSFAKVEEVQS